MNDIMKPGTTPTEGAPTGPNTLDLKTPEQRAAEQLAAKERAERAATQGGNTATTVDGMMPSSPPATETASVAGNTMTMEAPRTEPKVVPVPPSAEATPGSSVFKLPEDQVEQKQAAEQSGGSTSAQTESNPAQPETTQPSTDKKPGFFKRLFGGGKKQDLAPQAEQQQNPEQPQ